MAVTLRGRFVEAEAAGIEETTGFNLEDVTVVEADPQETPTLQARPSPSTCRQSSSASTGSVKR